MTAVAQLPRVFRYNSVELEDPGHEHDPVDVRNLYSATYPEITAAAIEGPEVKDGKRVYTFRKAVGTKGAETSAPLSQWAVVELFGHQRIAGLLSEQTIGGCQFLRVDVPDSGDQKGFTKLYGQGAIYGITFVEEAIARELAGRVRARPVEVYEVGNLLRLAHAGE